MRIVGLDLAGKDTNETGFCLLDFDEGKSTIATKNLLADREIIDTIQKAKPDVIAIDAPLSMPEQGYFRDSDKKLQQKGFDPLSPIFPGMKILTIRAMTLVKILSRDFKIIEAFPRATEKIMGLSKEHSVNENEYDALLCALTGKKFLEDDYDDLSGIIIPK